MKYSLANSVFRFFRYENKGEILLDHQTFKFKELFEDKDIEDKDIQTLITSLEQAGKTFLTIPVALIYLSFNIPVVYLVMDRNQKKQLHRRLNKIMLDLYKYLKTLKFEESELEKFLPENILYYDSLNKYKGDDLKNSLDGSKPRLIIVIKEYTQIKRINSFLKEENKIVLILDEVHKTGAYKKQDDIYHDDNIKYDDAIVYTKKFTKKIINISATAQDFIMVENLYSDNIVYIYPLDFHTGIKDWVWDNEFNTKNDKKSDIIPESVLNFLDKKNSENLIVRYDRKNEKVDLHPHIILCKYHRKLEKQKEMLSWLQLNLFFRDWTLILYQGEGITMFHKSFGKNSISIINEDGETQDSVVEDNMHFFSSNLKNSIGITDCLQFLAERGIEIHPKILIIGFDLVCEGISYTSHYNKPQNWHLTSIIAKFPSNTCAALQKQVLSRVNGNHGDDIKPFVAVDYIVKEKVLNSFEMSEKQIQKCINLSQTGNIKVCKIHLDNMIHFKNRVPKNHYKIKTIHTNTIPNPDAKKEKKILKNTKTSIDILYTFDPEKYKKQKDNIIQIRKVSDLRKTDFIPSFSKEKENIIEEENIYYILDLDSLKEGSMQFMIVDGVIKYILKNNMCNQKILRMDIINSLLSTIKFKTSSIHKIAGSLDVGIIKKMKKTSSIENKGLLYWKENGRFYFRFNN